MITKIFNMPLAKPSLAVSMLVPVLLLCGCGGSESDDGTTHPPVVEPAPVSARDGFNVVAPDAPGYVDLSSLIKSGTAGAKVTSVYLESKQGTGDCGQVFSSSEADRNDANIILGQGFNVTINGAAICEYTYEVESVALAGQAKTRAKARVMVASSAGGAAVLPPISIAIAISDPAKVTDIKAELEAKGSFPAGYTLSDDFSVLGDGDVILDAAAFSVSYTPTGEGVSRVVYALEGDVAGVPDIKMGTLDYAVSSDLNNAPTAEQFDYGSDVEINTSVDIDISDYVKDAIDGDDLQLIDVQSYTADVTSKAPGDMTNKVFTFEAAEAGEHYVSYTVSDHKGGFATAIVEVSTFDASQVAKWKGIEMGMEFFSAPQTKFEIDSSGDDYQGFYNDTAYTPTLQIAMFNLAGAQLYCGSRGRLPTQAEMAALYSDKSPVTSWQWPSGKTYLTEETSGAAGVFSLLDGTVSAIDGNLHYVTCVDSGGISILASKSVVVANGIDFSQVTASFMRSTKPVEGAVFDINISGSVTASAVTVTTGVDGLATFDVSSTKAGDELIGVTYTTADGLPVSVDANVKFIGDADTARVASVENTRQYAIPDGVDFDAIG